MINRMTMNVIAPLMATSPRRCLDRSRFAISAFLYAHRKESCTIPFEGDLREWTRWRSLQDRAIPYREDSLVAGTFKPVVFRRKVHGTRQVCALLAVGHIVVLASADQDAMILWGRVGEEFYTPNRDFTYLANLDRRKRWSLGKIRLRQNPKIADEHTEARERKKLSELAACHVALVAGEHGEFLSPERLPTRAAQKRHRTPPTCSPIRRGKPHPFLREPSCAPASRPSGFRTETRWLASPAVGQFPQGERRQAPGWGKPLRTSAVYLRTCGRSTCRISSSARIPERSWECRRDRRGRSSSSRCNAALTTTGQFRHRLS